VRGGSYRLHALFKGYVERFIFETSKISQLFCHQIIWNMKANCYKDDGGEVVSVASSKIFGEADLMYMIGGPNEADARPHGRPGSLCFVR
jgi:hypothetical protein